MSRRPHPGHVVTPAWMRVLLAGALVTLSTVASAHDLRLDFAVRDNRLRLRAYYPPDQPAGGAKITVTDGSGATIASGITNRRGRFDCIIGRERGLVIAAARVAGHIVSVRIERGHDSEGHGAHGATSLWKIPLGILLILSLFALIGGIVSRRRPRAPRPPAEEET